MYFHSYLYLIFCQLLNSHMFRNAFCNITFMCTNGCQYVCIFFSHALWYYSLHYMASEQLCGGCYEMLTICMKQFWKHYCTISCSSQLWHWMLPQMLLTSGMLVCSPPKIYRRFGEKYCLHLQGRKTVTLCRRPTWNGSVMFMFNVQPTVTYE
jgi:hypothetical protein